MCIKLPMYLFLFLYGAWTNDFDGGNFISGPKKAVVGKMTTFDLWPLPLGGGAWGAGRNMWHPETPASYESLPAPLATQIPTLWIHKSWGRGRGGALILDRCRAFDLFASVDAHLCKKVSIFRAPPFQWPSKWIFPLYKQQMYISTVSTSLRRNSSPQFRTIIRLSYSFCTIV